MFCRNRLHRKPSTFPSEWQCQAARPPFLSLKGRLSWQIIIKCPPLYLSDCMSWAIHQISCVEISKNGTEKPPTCLNAGLQHCHQSLHHRRLSAGCSEEDKTDTACSCCRDVVPCWPPYTSHDAHV